MVKKTPTSDVKVSFRIGPLSAKRLRAISEKTGLSQAKLVDGLIMRYGRELEEDLVRTLKGK